MRLVAALLLLCLVLTPATTSAQPRSAPPLRAVLDNGLTVIVAEQHAAEIVTVQAWVKFGSRDEDDATNGGAHFIEHMLFKGTTRRKVGEIDRQVEGLGGLLNASTYFDWTQYYIIGASRFFDRLLDVQADALMNSTFDPEEFERERLVIIEELNRRDDTPPTRTFDALYAIAYTVHPYRRPIGGTRDVIRQMTRDQLFGFYRAFYVPANVTVVVTGDVSAQDVLAKVRRAYSGWRRTGRSRGPVPSEPAMTAVRRVTIDEDVRLAYLRLGWIAPGVRDRDVYAADVLLYALGRGRGSRFVRNIRERLRLAQDISASFATGLDPTLFQVAAVVDPENLQRAEEAIVAEIASVRDAGITEAELARAKTLLEGEDILGNHTSRGLANSLGYYATIADVDFVLTYRDRVRAVTRADVQRVAQRFLDPQRYAAAAVRPRRP